MTKTNAKLNFKDLILYEDDHFIVVNKPPYVATLEDRNSNQNILALSKAYHEDAQVCHRLDKETSGVLVVAKHPEAYRYFAMSLERRKIKKVYHAVIDGIHEFENVEANQPIYSSNSKSRVDFQDGKPSLTLIQTLEHFKKHTLVKCFPVTGRLHQIRVHLSYHRAPISCDPLYGGEWLYLSSIKRKYHMSTKDDEEQPLMKRVALHANEIAFADFDDPEKIIEVVAPYPKDFAVLVKQLKKNS